MIDIDEDWKRYLQMAASGALTGGSLGGIGKILSGSRSIGGILGATAAGGALGATAVPGAAYLGEQALGAPTEEELQPYTMRAGLGGAAVGAGVGGVAGAGIGSGLAATLGKAVPGVANFAKGNMPLDNIIVDRIKRMGGLKGALAGSALGAVGMGFMAGDEGQQLDTIRNLMRRKKDGLPDGSLGGQT